MVKFIKGYTNDQDAMEYVEKKKRRMQDPNYRPNPDGQLSDDDFASVGMSAVEVVGKGAEELGSAMPPNPRAATPQKSSSPPPPRTTGSRTEVAEDLPRYERFYGRKPDFDLDPHPPNVVFKNVPARRQDASVAGEPASQFAETPSSVVGSLQRGYQGMYASPGYRRVTAEEESGDSDEDDEWENDDW